MISDFFLNLNGPAVIGNIAANAGAAALYFLAMLIPLIITRVILHKLARDAGQKMGRIRGILIFVFCFFLAGVFAVTGVPSIYQLNFDIYDIALQPWSYISWTSFQTRYNVIMFVPFGFLLPLLWKKYQNPLRLIFASLLFTVAIEFSQMFNPRTTDIDDVILNLIGAVAGYVIYLAVALVLWLIYRDKKVSRERAAKHELCIYMFIGWVSAMAIYPVMRDLIIQII